MTEHGTGRAARGGGAVGAPGFNRRRVAGLSPTGWTWLVVLVALLLRAGFAAGAEAVHEIAGDTNQYVHYARNLLLHGIYSSAQPAAGVIPVPDSFRPPGYPLFLAATMSAAADGGWVALAKALQIALSTATVLLTILIGREWMRPVFALAAGTLMAIWPHQVVFAATLLSETLFGFTLALGTWLLLVAERRRSRALAAAAGLAFGAACMVNMLAAFLPAGLALLLVRRHGRLAPPLLAAFLVLPLAWIALALPMSGTNAEAPSSADRLAMNLVQGSWPQYHLAWRTRHNNDMSRRILRAIEADVEAVVRSPAEGLAAVAERLATEPARYAKWYLIEKPYDLWGWDIQLGWGGIYFLQMHRSPYERQPLPKASLALVRAVNPFVFAMALLSIVLGTVTLLRHQPVPPGVVLCAACFVYFTALHILLQAEPRYAVPYRPFEVLLALQLVSVGVALQRRRGEDCKR